MWELSAVGHFLCCVPPVSVFFWRLRFLRGHLQPARSPRSARTNNLLKLCISLEWPTQSAMTKSTNSSRRPSSPTRWGALECSLKDKPSIHTLLTVNSSGDDTDAPPHNNDPRALLYIHQLVTWKYVYNNGVVNRWMSVEKKVCVVHMWQYVLAWADS